MKKYRKIQKKIDVWLLNFDKINCSGCVSYTDDWGYNDDGVSAIEALYYYESSGVKKKCNDLETLENFFQAKGSLDLQIKMWAEDRAKGWLNSLEMNEYIDELNYPEWVLKAVENQAKVLRAKL